MYPKELFVFNGDTPISAIIRNYEVLNHFPDLIRIQRESSPPPFPSE